MKTATMARLALLAASFLPLAARSMPFAGSGPAHASLATSGRAVAGATYASLDNVPYAMAGSWFDPATSGQGFDLQVFPNADGGKLAILYWYTFDRAAAQKVWLLASGPIVGNAAHMQLFESTPYQPFDRPAPAGTQGHAVGMLDFQLQDCSGAHVAWHFDQTLRSGLNASDDGEASLTRLTPVTSVLGADLCSTPLQAFAPSDDPGGRCAADYASLLADYHSLNSDYAQCENRLDQDEAAIADLEAAVSSLRADVDSAYDDGYDDGYNDGYSDGYGGSSSGYEEGYDDGYSDGYSAGYDEDCSDDSYAAKSFGLRMAPQTASPLLSPWKGRRTPVPPPARAKPRPAMSGAKPATGSNDARARMDQKLQDILQKLEAMKKAQAATSVAASLRR